MTGIRRLAPPQSRRVNALVRRECCNYDCGNCILLDNGDECACPQTISFSLLCKWFRIAVLPADKELYAELYAPEDRRRCEVCFKLKQRQILPGLPEANTAQTSRRTQAETAAIVTQ